MFQNSVAVSEYKKNQVQTANFIFPDPNKKNQTVRISIPDATAKIPEGKQPVATLLVLLLLLSM